MLLFWPSLLPRVPMKNFLFTRTFSLKDSLEEWDLAVCAGGHWIVQEQPGFRFWVSWTGWLSWQSCRKIVTSYSQRVRQGMRSARQKAAFLSKYPFFFLAVLKCQKVSTWECFISGPPLVYFVNCFLMHSVNIAANKAEVWKKMCPSGDFLERY